MLIKIYNVTQTGPKTQLGGDKLDFVNDAYHVSELFLVTNPEA